MDERTLSELLECSVCLEQLNADSRVLPCQHTFCRSCLDEIVRAKKELRCPECRLLIRCRIEDLPTNLLLVRLLGGLKSSEKTTEGEKSDKKSLVHAARKLAYNEHANFLQLVAHVSSVTGTSAFHQTPSVSLQASGSSQVVYSTVMPMSPPCIRCYALYNYKHAKDDELDLKKGDVYTIVEKCEDGWYRGSAFLHPERVGFFPGNYVQETSSSDAVVVTSTSVGLDSRSGGGAGLTVPSPHMGVLRAHSFPKTSPLAGADLAGVTVRARPSISLLIPPRPITNITQAQSRHLIGSLSPSAISVASKSQVCVTTDCSAACPAPVVSLLSPVCGGGVHVAVDKKADSSSAAGEEHHVVLRASASSRRQQQQQAKMRGLESRHSAHCSLASSPGTGSGSDAVVVETDASSATSSKKEDKAEGSSSSKPSLLKRLSQVGLSLTHHRPRSARAADLTPSPTQPAPGVPTSSISSPTDSRRLGPKMTTLANLLHRSSFSELSEQSTVVVPDDVTVLQHRLSGSLNFGRSKNKAAHSPAHRCQCVIPYPANSDLELDLKVGDIVAVHKMNADGWFRGTHMRTGHVGYFPASFVRSCS